ncbi:hypothetical protein AMTR_s00137p00068430 [Amborella trichopoda]|uniref:Uncharacterized protein n=1 Tax=Amborella trichopoda TaxID=13333 RepID=W1NDV3_AMBTC|nr:hypothetical protein AMTR_s00137p00068430 [Amborella trichopoda]
MAEESSSSVTPFLPEIYGSDSGWVEARTSCDHLSVISSDLSHIPAMDTPCSRFLLHFLNTPLFSSFTLLPQLNRN